LTSVSPFGPRPFHHCCDICSSISSIFLSVSARPSDFSKELLMLNDEGVTVASKAWAAASRWRSFRSMSNSRRRTKSLRWRRSIISLSISRL
jgi:hypothetical protein